MRKLAVVGILAVGALMLVAGLSSTPTRVNASSHREAPLISLDPQADNNDVYAFTSPDRPDSVTIIATYIPLEGPAAGPNFYRFSDDVQYSLHIDNNGSGADTIRYDFEFKTTFRDAAKTTFLYNSGPVTKIDDPNLNVLQSYTITRVDHNGSKVVGKDIPVAPWNAGGLSFPNYDAVANQAIKKLDDGSVTFAGPRADPFFVDLAIFDLLNIRSPLLGTAGSNPAGFNTLAGLNTHTIALQVPKSLLVSNGVNPTDPMQSTSIVGIWATAQRHAMTVLRGVDSPQPEAKGDWIQVSRLGNPLFNEVVIPMALKDRWNAGTPQDTIKFDAQFGGDPILAQAIKAIYGLKVPPQPATGGPVRDDLAAVFLTGIPALTMPASVTPAEELRINLATPLSADPKRLTILQGDFQGWPNGRRLADDIVDIAEAAVAGAAYPLFHKDYTPDPLAAKLNDGVDAPDRPYLTTFPYAASPYSGDTGPFSHK